MKSKILAVAFAAITLSQSNAAIYSIANIVDGATDTLYSNTSNVPLTSGIVTLGVFAAGFDVNANLSNPASLIANFTSFASGAIGSTGAFGPLAGYAQVNEPVDTASILAGNALLGRVLYSFVGDGATLGSSNAFALLSMGPLKEDDPNENEYNSNPQSRIGAPLIGSIGNFNGDVGLGAGTYQTLQLTPAIPEPSVALLGLLGAVGFFRRRR